MCLENSGTNAKISKELGLIYKNFISTLFNF